MPIEIVPPGVNINFVGRWRQAVAGSIVLLVLSLAGVFALGVRFGIDFAGGTEIHIRLSESEAAEGEVRRLVEEIGIESPSVVRFGAAENREFLIRFASETLEQTTQASAQADARSEPQASGVDGGSKPQASEAEPDAAEQAGEAAVEPDVVERLSERLSAAFEGVEVLRVDFVGPRVGSELRRDGLKALAYACGLILIYIGFRFTLRFAPGAVLALIHDVLITAGVWVLLGEEFNLQVLAALLAILGYSLNDTIILYDRIRENMEIRTTTDLPEVLNRSVNQTLSRTLLTSGTTILAVMALLFLGGEVIRPFALAMAIGIVVGTYSSIYIAAPTLLVLERRFGAAA